jgi:hypothetical protein
MALENALFDYVPRNKEAFARAFLSGLSADELVFVAEFLGSCVLITSGVRVNTWDAVCNRAGAFCRGREHQEDSDHKYMLLSEFAACCGFAIRYR